MRDSDLGGITSWPYSFFQGIAETECQTKHARRISFLFVWRFVGSTQIRLYHVVYAVLYLRGTSWLAQVLTPRTLWSYAATEMRAWLDKTA